MPRTFLAVLVMTVSMVGLVSRSFGGDCCRHCGCDCNLKKFCKLVCENKKVPETHYDVKCEDICLHGKSHKCGCEWIPSCGRVKTVKKLVKVETTKTVPAYKCVVETICCDCYDKLGQNDAHAPPATLVAGAQQRTTPTVAKPASEDDAPQTQAVSEPADQDQEVLAPIVTKPAGNEKTLAPAVSRRRANASADVSLPPIVSRPIPKKTK